MEINSLPGSAAHTNVSTPPVDNTTTRDQNIEASQTAQDNETNSAAQGAFEVTITPEARERIDQERIGQERLAADAEAQQVSEQADVDQIEATENQNDQHTPVERGSGPIVNIVA